MALVTHKAAAVALPTERAPWPPDNLYVDPPLYQVSAFPRPKNSDVYSDFTSSNETLEELEAALNAMLLEDPPAEVRAHRWLMQILQSYTQAPTLERLALRCVHAVMRAGYAPSFLELGVVELSVQLIVDWPDRPALVAEAVGLLLTMSACPRTRAYLLDPVAPTLEALVPLLMMDEAETVESVVHLLWNLSWTSAHRGRVPGLQPQRAVMDCMRRWWQSATLVRTGLGLLWALAGADGAVRATLYADVDWVTWALQLVQEQPECEALCCTALGLLLHLAAHSCVFCAWLVTLHSMVFPLLGRCGAAHGQSPAVMEQWVGLAGVLCRLPLFRVRNGLPAFVTPEGPDTEAGAAPDAAEPAAPPSHAGPTGTLTLQFKWATLPYVPDDLAAKMRPYFTLELGGQAFRTATLEGQNPAYQEIFTFLVEGDTRALHWEARHEPTGTPLDRTVLLLNEGSVPVAELLEAAAQQRYDTDSKAWAFAYDLGVQYQYRKLRPEEDTVDLEWAVLWSAEAEPPSTIVDDRTLDSRIDHVFSLTSDQLVALTTAPRPAIAQAAAESDEPTGGGADRISGALSPEGAVFDSRPLLADHGLVQLLDTYLLPGLDVGPDSLYTDSEGLVVYGWTAVHHYASGDPSWGHGPEYARRAVAYLRGALGPGKQDDAPEAVVDALVVPEADGPRHSGPDTCAQYPVRALPLPALPPPSISLDATFPPCCRAPHSAVRTLPPPAAVSVPEPPAAQRPARLHRMLLLTSVLNVLQELVPVASIQKYLVEQRVSTLMMQVITDHPEERAAFVPALCVMEALLRTQSALQHFVEDGGVASLVRALRTYPGNALVCEKVYAVLERLCAIAAARQQIPRGSGLQLLLDALTAFPGQWAVLTKVLGILVALPRDLALQYWPDLNPKALGPLRRVAASAPPDLLPLCEMALTSVRTLQLEN